MNEKVTNAFYPDGSPAIVDQYVRSGLARFTYQAAQNHKVSARYLYQYANEAAWKEDHRREANGAQASRALGLALASPVSRQWAGYWQRACNL